MQHLSPFVWLISLRIMPSRFTHVVTSGRILCMCVCVCVCVFTSSLCVSRHLVVSVSWLLSKIIQKTWEYRYLLETEISFPLDIYPEVESLDHIVGIFLIFWGPSILFSIVAIPICIPTDSAEGFPLPHIIANTYYLFFFDNGHSNRCEMISHCGSDLHFPDN